MVAAKHTGLPGNRFDISRSSKLNHIDNESSCYAFGHGSDNHFRIVPSGRLRFPRVMMPDKSSRENATQNEVDFYHSYFNVSAGLLRAVFSTRKLMVTAAIINTVIIGSANCPHRNDIR
jgi:hypothetical protein